MRAIKRELESAVAGESPILITGESGTGKTLMAQAIAEASGRRPIVRATLGASDDLNTITSELFGHERGAFSGATTKRMGLVEFADGGTLILDEILNLPPHAQQLLLDFTQFGTYRPLGYSRAEPKRARVRHHRRDQRRSARGHPRAALPGGPRTTASPRSRWSSRRCASGARTSPRSPRARCASVDPARAWTLSMPLRRLLVSPTLDWSGNVRQLERAVERARERAVARDPEATVLTPEHLESRDVDHASIDEAQATTSSPPGEPLGTTWQKLQAERGRLDAARAVAAQGGAVRVGRRRGAGGAGAGDRADDAVEPHRRARASASRSGEAGGGTGPRAEGPPALPRVPARSPCDVNRLRPRPTRFPLAGTRSSPRDPRLSGSHEPLLRRRGST